MLQMSREDEECCWLLLLYLEDLKMSEQAERHEEVLAEFCLDKN